MAGFLGAVKQLAERKIENNVWRLLCDEIDDFSQNFRAFHQA
jgi:hypothetical protein